MLKQDTIEIAEKQECGHQALSDGVEMLSQRKSVQIYFVLFAFGSSNSYYGQMMVKVKPSLR